MRSSGPHGPQSRRPHPLAARRSGILHVQSLMGVRVDRAGLYPLAFNGMSFDPTSAAQARQYPPAMRRAGGAARKRMRSRKCLRRHSCRCSGEASTSRGVAQNGACAGCRRLAGDKADADCPRRQAEPRAQVSGTYPSLCCQTRQAAKSSIHRQTTLSHPKAQRPHPKAQQSPRRQGRPVDSHSWKESWKEKGGRRAVVG